MSVSEKLFLCPVLLIQEDFIIFFIFQIKPDAEQYMENVNMEM